MSCSRQVLASAVPAALAALVLIAAAGCATAPKKPLDKVFFPPPPDLPRIQYLTSFTGKKDVKEQSAFNKFVVGEKADVKIDKPYGVALHDGKIYVCDTNATLIAIDLKQSTFGPIKGAMEGQGVLRQPLNIFITTDGTKYVTDPERGQVVVYDRNDDYVKAYGTPGGWRPVDAVPFEDRLYVADAGNWVVKVFDLASGDILKTIGDKGDPAQRLDRPTNLAFDRQGYLYVTDVGRFQVVKFDRDGHFVSTFGDIGDSPGHFARPKGIALDREGRLLVADAAFSNVQIFNGEGRLLLPFGNGPKDAPGTMVLPAKVALDYDNLSYFEKFLQPGFRADYLILVTSQFGDYRINIYAYGRDSKAKYPSDEELMKQLEERSKKEQEKLDKAKQDQPSPETPAPEPEHP